jgi:predicted ribosomally synthesized peptide with SipW-like signal peptide
MKKILGLLIALIAVIAMVGVGTWSFFNDVVTSTGNTISAGTLTLTVDGATGTGHFAITKVKPSDKGTAGTYTLSSGAGDINGDLYAKIANLASPAGPKGGTLSSGLKIAFWVDMNGGGWDNAADYYINPADGTQVFYTGSELTTYGGAIPDAAYAIATTFATAGHFDGTVKLASDQAGGTNFGTFYTEYYFPNTTGDHFASNADNTYQGATMSFDISFALVQAGH